MRSRFEILLLFAALLAVSAFVGSFVAGLREPRLPIQFDAERSAGGGGASARAPVGGVGAGGWNMVADPARADRAGARIRVEVLNAAGRPGLARHGTERLRARGFDVVYFGNAPGGQPDSSVVIDRAGDLAAARSVADALHIRNVVSRPDSNLYLDVTVILSSDWPPDTPEVGGGVRGWLERFLGR